MTSKLYNNVGGEGGEIFRWIDLVSIYSKLRYQILFNLLFSVNALSHYTSKKGSNTCGSD